MKTRYQVFMFEVEHITLSILYNFQLGFRASTFLRNTFKAEFPKVVRDVTIPFQIPSEKMSSVRFYSVKPRLRCHSRTTKKTSGMMSRHRRRKKPKNQVDTCCGTPKQSSPAVVVVVSFRSKMKFSTRTPRGTTPGAGVDEVVDGMIFPSGAFFFCTFFFFAVKFLLSRLFRTFHRRWK